MGASKIKEAKGAVSELASQVGQADMKYLLFYASPHFDLKSLATELKAQFGSTPVVGCTSAGEISELGYQHGSLVGVSIGGDEVEFETALFNQLRDSQDIQAGCQKLQKSKAWSPDKDRHFAFMLIDGLSMQEELFTSMLSSGLADIPLFGGSAGDELKFDKTYVYVDGAFHQDAAVVTLVKTDAPFVVFKTQHFIKSDQKIVITQADPKNRVVYEMNGEVAIEAYAKLVGCPKDQLTPEIFSLHPVVVTIGGGEFVRSIQKANPDGSLTFYCAIDEGVVLSLAQGVDYVDNLKKTFQDITQKVGEPELILGCDCILRHLEMDRKGIKEEVGELMKKHRVIGFSTYGEQFQSMHVNQTFTGVALGKKAA